MQINDNQRKFEKKIEELREKLNNLIKKHDGDLLTREILELSTLLDSALSDYNKLKK